MLYLYIYFCKVLHFPNIINILMQNARARVQDLKIEISLIGKKITLPSLADPNFQGNPLIFDNIREKEEFQKKIKTLKAATTEKRQSFLSGLQQISKKLHSLSVKKQKALKTKSARVKYISRIQSLELELKKVSQEYSSFCEKLSRHQKFHYNSSIAHQLQCEESLNPIESNLSTIASQHLNLSETLENLQREVERMRNVSYMAREDILSLSTSRAEMILEREGIETQIEMMEFEYCDELEYDQQEDEFIQKMLKFKKTKDPCNIQEIEIQNSIRAVDVNLSNSLAKIKMIEQEFLSICKGNPEEIKTIEDIILEKSKAFNTDSMTSVVVDTNNLEGFDIDEEILKIQLEEVKKAESHMRKLWRAEEEVVLEKIKMAKEYWGSTVELEKELKSMRRIQRIHMASINQWKSKASSSVKISENTAKPVADNIILREFKAQFSSITYKEHRKLESLLSAYMSHLEKREKSYNMLLLPHKIKEKAIAAKEISTLILEKPALALKEIQVKKELQRLESQEKRMLNEMKETGVIPNPTKAQLYLIKEKLENWDDVYKEKTIKIDENKAMLKDCCNTMNLLQKDIDGLKLNLEHLSVEEYKLSSQVANILEKKKTDMLSSLQDLLQQSKNPEELKLYQLKYKTLEASVKLEKVNKELSEFDSKNNEIIAGIEQEDMQLRKDQIEIETELKLLETEQGFIDEYEGKMKKLDEFEATPLALEQSRSPAEEFYRKEIRDAGDYGGAIEGSYLEFAEKSLGKQSSLAKGGSRALTKKYYRFKLEGTSQPERSFFERIMPLLEGAELYKRSANPVKKSSYNPLDDITPEVCGYCTRYFYLHKSLEKIEIRHPMKPGFEAIRLDQIVSPKVSKLTMTILHTQGHLDNEDLDYQSPYPDFISTFSDISTQDLCKNRENMLYPFTIALTNKDKVRVIAKNYLTFKQWINGINALIKNRKKILKLRTRIECYTSV